MSSPAPSLPPVETVAVIGAGYAGVELALRCGRAGFTTILEDVLPAKLRRAAGLLSELPSPSLIHYAGSVEEAVRTADLVLDTVPDELESKLELWTLLDRMAPPAALFATPTLALSAADLASCTYRPKQCFTLRLLAAPQIQLAYVPACLPETVGRMEGFLETIGFRVESAPDLSDLP